MRCPNLRRVWLLLAFASSCWLCAAERPPNTVFILVDDLGPEQLGCYGGTAIQTPHIDRLAADGVRFRTCYTVSVCSPSRVLLLTGRYGFRTGWFNFTGRPGSPRRSRAGWPQPGAGAARGADAAP